jgi:DNA-binding XRE family transcriptional regulator
MIAPFVENVKHNRYQNAIYSDKNLLTAFNLSKVYYSKHFVYRGISMVRVKVNQRAFEIALSKENLSQRDLAEQIGFSRSHMSYIITGKREPSPTMRRLILEHLNGYTFDDLFIIEEGGNGDRNKA